MQTETEWSRCATWGKLGEIDTQYLHKGSRVYVAGRLHTSRWENAQTGEPRASVEIVVDDLILLDCPTPTATQEDAQDAGEPLPGAPAPAPRPSPSNRSAGHRSRSASTTHRLSRRNVATTANTTNPSQVTGRSRLGTPKSDTTTGGY